ncbi:MAG: hypothetical protein WA459_25695, partial [Stellaceae bacterium]
TSPAIDVTLAKRVLADPKLYSAALHALATSTHLSQSAPAGGRTEPLASPPPALTGVNRALSSGTH